MKRDLILLIFTCFIGSVNGTIHYLSLREETRRNIALTKFGYDDMGTLQFNLSNFTVPDEVVSFKQSRENRETEKFGLIGFTLSRGSVISEGVRSNPHVCQLTNTDQGIDALFFIFDFTKERLKVVRSGSIGDLKLCSSLQQCPFFYDDSEVNATRSPEGSVLKRIWNKIVPPDEAVEMRDYVPLVLNDTSYNTQFAIRFFGSQRGEYQMFYHNCFNYKSNGYNDLVAVDFAVSIIEMNKNSYLSAGDSIKPHIYFYLAFCFAMASIAWIHKLCRSDSNMVFRVHKLMTALVVLKTLSVFFHGMNYYYAAEYGHQQELWAVIFYITHLLKGALLFGTIILIGSGYTLFKSFLSDRDRNLFMIVLPLQIIDNIVMAIIDESEFAEQRYYFWVEVFMFLDLICCVAIILPIIWSIKHLEDGARTDGKAAFNLEKLKLFRHFYVIVIAYIYLTRFAKFMFDQTLPFNYEWLSVAITETATLVFFVLVGYKFRPVKTNPYLKLQQDDRDDDEAIVLTPNGLFENVTKVQRITVTDETNDIPGTIGGYSSDSDENSTLLKTRNDVSIL